MTSDINPKSIARGIVHVTAILAHTDNIDTCQKFTSITGRVKLSAESVKTKAS